VRHPVKKLLVRRQLILFKTEEFPQACLSSGPIAEGG
jgi:hypothetical protein